MDCMLELDFDPEGVCRICISSTNKLLNIFSNTVVDGYITAIPDMITNCLDIQVLASDGLPNKICSACKLEITNFYIFKQKSKRTEKVLYTTVKGSDPPQATKVDTIKDEPHVRTITPVIESIPEIVNIQSQCTLCGTLFDSEDLLYEHCQEEHMNTIEVEEPRNIKLEAAEENSELLQILMNDDNDDEDINDAKSEQLLTDENELGEDENSELIILEADAMDEDLYEELEYEIANEELHNQDETGYILGTSSKQEPNIEFVCEICSKEFTTSKAIKRHMKLCHSHRTLTDAIDSELKMDISENLNSETAYECNTCGSVYLDEQSLLEHCNEHNSHAGDADNRSNKKRLREISPLNFNGDFNCVHCTKKLKTRLSYEQHIKMHESMNIVHNYLTFYPCHTCRTIFLTEDTLQDHKNEIHQSKDKVDESCTDYQFLDDDGYEDTDYNCGICGSIFSNPNDAKYHVVMHSEKFICPYDDCGCQYEVFSRYTMHIMNKHVNNELHQCTHCALECGSYDDLQSHLKNDCSERKFACTHCEKKFFSKKALQHHVKNTEGKTFMCQFCGKSFAQPGELNIHNRSHTGERPYACTICGKRYKTSSMRAAHMDAHIPGKTFPCTLCDKKLQTRTSYRNHMRRHTEEKKHECDYCGKRFFTRYHVKLHTMKMHEKPSRTDVGIIKIDGS